MVKPSGAFHSKQFGLLGLALLLLLGGGWLWKSAGTSEPPPSVWAAPDIDPETALPTDPEVLVGGSAPSAETRTAVAPLPENEPELADVHGPIDLAVRLVNDLRQPLGKKRFRIEWRPIRTGSGGYSPSQVEPARYVTDAEGYVSLPSKLRLLGGGVVFHGDLGSFGMGCVVELPSPERLEAASRFSKIPELIVPRPVVVKGQVQSVIPVDDVQVTFWPGGPEGQDLATGPHGHFVLPAVSPLCTQLRFRRMHSGDRVSIDLVPGMPALSVQPDLSKGTWVQGVVLDPAGSPLAGARVRLTQAEETPGWGISRTFAGTELSHEYGKQAETDEQGRFVLGLEKDELKYRIIASGPGGTFPGKARVDGEVQLGETVRTVLKMEP